MISDITVASETRATAGTAHGQAGDGDPAPANAIRHEPDRRPDGKRGQTLNTEQPPDLCHGQSQRVAAVEWEEGGERAMQHELRCLCAARGQHETDG